MSQWDEPPGLSALVKVAVRSLSSSSSSSSHSLTETVMWRRRSSLRGHRALLSQALCLPTCCCFTRDRRWTKTLWTKRPQIHIVWVVTRLHPLYLSYSSVHSCRRYFTAQGWRFKDIPSTGWFVLETSSINIPITLKWIINPLHLCEQAHHSLHFDFFCGIVAHRFSVVC